MFVRGIPPTVNRGRKLSNPVVCGMGDKNLCSSFCPGLTMLSQASHKYFTSILQRLCFLWNYPQCMRSNMFAYIARSSGSGNRAQCLRMLSTNIVAR